MKKKQFYRLIILFLFTFCLKVVIAQEINRDYIYNNEIYWNYRYNLTKWFVMEGVGEIHPFSYDLDRTAIGYGIPANRIHAFENPISGNYENLPDWGDATLHLGWYLGVLATEYRLLKNTGQSTKYVEEELYYALKAFERIDLRAEANTPPFLINEGYGEERNGFFVRDDVWKLTPEFKKIYPKANDAPFITEEYPDAGVPGNNIPSDYVGVYRRLIENNYIWKGKENNFFMTVDQLAGLFMGFALINKCIDANTFYSEVDGNKYYFRDEARLNVRLIMEYLKSHNWKILFPDGTKTRHATGLEARVPMYGLTEVADYILGTNYKEDLDPPGWTIDDTGWNYKNFWNSWFLRFFNRVNYDRNNHDFAVAIGLCVAATGNSWYRTFTIPWLPVNYVTKVNITDKKLKKEGEFFDQHFFLLLNNYLHNTDEKYDQTIIEYFLNTAPCHNPLMTPTMNSTKTYQQDGTKLKVPIEFEENPNFDARWYNYGNKGVEGWRAPNRWWRPLIADDGFEGNPTNEDLPNRSGIYYGVDYMLLHNLFNLVYNIEPDRYYTDKEHYILSESISYTPENTRREGANDITAYDDMIINADVSNTTGHIMKIQAGEEVSVKAGVNLKGNIDLKTGTVSACEVIPLYVLKERRSYQKTPHTVANPIRTTKSFQTNQKSANIDTLAHIDKKENNDYVPLETYLVGRTNTTPPVITRPERCLLYPNPAVSDFSLMIESNTEQEISINIYNNTGQNCKTISESLQKGENTFNIAVSELQNGVYFVKVQTKDNYFIKKLIKK